MTFDKQWNGRRTAVEPKSNVVWPLHYQSNRTIASQLKTMSPPRFHSFAKMDETVRNLKARIIDITLVYSDNKKLTVMYIYYNHDYSPMYGRKNAMQYT